VVVDFEDAREIGVSGGTNDHGRIERRGERASTVNLNLGGIDVLRGDLHLGVLHAEEQGGDEGEVEQGHHDALPGSDFEIALFSVGFFSKEREQAGDGHDEDEQNDEVKMQEQEGDHADGADDPKPRGDGGDDATAVEETDGGQVEQVQKVTGVGEAGEKRL